MLKVLFQKLKAGTFLAQDAMYPESQTYGGGLIKRTAMTAAAMNNTHINRRGPQMLRDAQSDQYEDTQYGYMGPSAAANLLEPYRFQYVTQNSYAGLLPWEILPQIPERNPWE